MTKNTRNEKIDVEEIIENGGVHFQTIFEMAGKPKEHVEQTFKDYIESINKDPLFDVLVADMAEFVEVEGTESLFSSFCEMEVVVKKPSLVIDFIFKYMPASLEVIEPSEFVLDSTESTGMFNDLIAKLHQFDMHAKETNQKIIVLANTNKNLAENLIHIVLTGPLTLKQIEERTGMKENILPPYLQSLIQKGKIKQVGTTYERV
jgi:hypothetical protein